MLKLVIAGLFLFNCAVDVFPQNRVRVVSQFEYKLLATNRTTTMEKELNIAANQGYRFAEVIRGETYVGGSEALVVMSRPINAQHKPRFEYRLLTRTSTMQKELQQAGDAGFEYCGHSVFRKAVGTEVMVILERDREAKPTLWDYKLLATRRTSTMQ